MVDLDQQTGVSDGVSQLKCTLDLPGTMEHLKLQIKCLLRKKCHYSDHEVDDIAQDCLAKVWEKRQEYDPSLGAPLAWIYGFAIRFVKSYLRKSGRLPQHLPSDHALIDAIMHIDNSEPKYQELSIEAVHSIVDQFTGMDRQLIQLTWIQGKSNQEIIALTGLTYGALRTRQTRLKRRIQAQLQETLQEGTS